MEGFFFIWLGLCGFKFKLFFLGLVFNFSNLMMLLVIFLGMISEVEIVNVFFFDFVDGLVLSFVLVLLDFLGFMIDLLLLEYFMGIFLIFIILILSMIFDVDWLGELDMLDLLEDGLVLFEVGLSELFDFKLNLFFVDILLFFFMLDVVLSLLFKGCFCFMEDGVGWLFIFVMLLGLNLLFDFSFELLKKVVDKVFFLLLYFFMFLFGKEFWFGVVFFWCSLEVLVVLGCGFFLCNCCLLLVDEGLLELLEVGSFCVFCDLFDSEGFCFCCSVVIE